MMRSRPIALNLRYLLVLILVSYAVVVSAFIDAGLRNYLVLFAAVLGGALLLRLRLPMQRQPLWAFVLFAVMAASGLAVGGMKDLGSVALTLIYSLGYFAVASLLEKVKDKRAFIKGVMRGIIYAYAAVSVGQMVASLAGLPVPNLIASKGLWSYNSLAFEPSQLGRVVGISMLCYLILDRFPALSEHPRETQKTRKKVIFCFLTTMLLSGSALAAIAIIAVFIFSRSFMSAFLIGIAVILFWPMVQLIDYDPLNRAAILISSLGDMNIDEMFRVESSGAVRIAPLLVYLESASLTDFRLWTGYGFDGLEHLFLGVFPGMGDIVSAGFVPGFSVVYGILITIIFINIFIIIRINNFTIPLIVFWIIFIATSSWNTQVFWYGLIVIHVTWAASREAVPAERWKPA